MRSWAALLVGAGLLTLAGCGGASDSYGAQLLQGALARFQGEDAEAEPTSHPRERYTRARIEQVGQPLLYAELQRSGLYAVMTRVGRNGDRVTWVAPDGVSVTLTGAGLLTATRGIGPDLMSSDVADVEAALARGGTGEAVRVQRYLGGDQQEVIRSQVCRFEAQGRETIEVFGAMRATTRIVETCRLSDGSFENIYWRGADGALWQSVQWGGPDLGHVRIEYLHRG